MAVPAWVSRFNNQTRDDSDHRRSFDNRLKPFGSSSLIPGTNSSWHDHRRLSLQHHPIRWHSNYQNNNESTVSLPRKQSTASSGLDPIPEDGWHNSSFPEIHQPRNNSESLFGKQDRFPEIHQPRKNSESLFGKHERRGNLNSSHKPLNSETMFSENFSDNHPNRPYRGMTPPTRTHSEPDLIEAVKDKVAPKRRISLNPKSNFKTVNNDLNLLDTRSDKSEGRKSHRSSRSAASIASTSKRLDTSRRQSLKSVDDKSTKSSVRRYSEASSVSKLPLDKYPSSPTSDSSPFAKIEIPIELLETPSRRLKKILGPVIMCILAISLAGSLGIAVYFATVLKETQEKQIDFLHAHLEMAIRNKNIDLLASPERQTLAVAYCKTMDKFYTGSELRTIYRGCEVVSLRDDKISFTLFFTEDRYTPEEVIIKVIKDRAPSANSPGQAQPLVMVDQLELDLATAKIKLETKKEAEDFNKIILHDPGATTASSLDIRTTTTTTTTTQTPSTSTERTTTPVATTNPDKKTKLSEVENFSNVVPSMYVITTSVPSNTTPTPEIGPCSGKNGGFIPHQTECNLYYECQNNKAILLYCGEMVFDFEKNVCVLKTPGFDCDRNDNVITSVSPSGTYIMPEDETGNRTDPVYEWDPCKNHTGNYFPHPVECDLFFQCAHGKSVLRLCQSGLLYNWEAKVCTKNTPDVVCPDPAKAPPRPKETATTTLNMTSTTTRTPTI